MGEYVMRVRDFFPEAPADWLDWPAEIEVAFSLLEGQGVNQSLYEEYAVSTMEEAVDNIFAGTNDCIFVHYRLHTVSVVPLFEWYLSRGVKVRGRKGTYSRREEIETAFPGEFEPENTLLELWNDPRGYNDCIRMLRVGGRGKKDALSNWEACIGEIRRTASRLFRVPS
jgi:hypothetical protein